MSSNEEIEGTQEPEYVSMQEVEEVVAEDDDEAEQIGNGVQLDEHGQMEIDLSNNSQAYFDQHEDSIFTVSTHPTLPLAVTGGGDNVAYLWTTHTSPTRFVSKLEGYTESVIASGFTGDGKYLITGDMTGKVLVHKAKKRGQVWEQLAELQQVEEVSWIAVHPKLDVFAFGGHDGSVWVYQIDASVDLVFTGYSHSLECTAGEFFDTENTNGELKLITTSEDGSILGWNCYTQQQLFRLDSAALKGLSPPWVSLAVHGKVAAIGARDSQIAIVNLETGTILTVFEAEKTDDVFDASIEGLAWCESLNFVAVGLVSGHVFILDTNTWQRRKTLKCGDAVTKLVFLKESPFVLASSMDGKVYKWDARTGAEVHTYVGHHLGVLDFSIDCGGRIVTAGDEGVALVFDP